LPHIHPSPLVFSLALLQLIQSRKIDRELETFKATISTLENEIREDVNNWEQRL